jgi:uncharacterized protein involved in high-affinity Fe2+ transport
MFKYCLTRLVTAACVTALFSTDTFAIEYPAGTPQIAAGMEIAAVYLQPIEMDPPRMMRDATQSDVHLEADIHATAGNKNGFADGEWVPYLEIDYMIAGPNGAHASGALMPMVASDGPHYGDNVKLFGPGPYRLTFTIKPPGPHSHFGRHIDRETGVEAWFEPFMVEYNFIFAGTGKKGSY